MRWLVGWLLFLLALPRKTSNDPAPALPWPPQVNDRVFEMLLPVKDDDEAVKTRGVELAEEMCSKLLKEGYCDGIHFYTLNLERSVRRILEKMNVLDSSNHGKIGRKLPWRPSTLANRQKEEVRPINWANRPKSYMKRTEDWDEFPNGRWGGEAA